MFGNQFQCPYLYWFEFLLKLMFKFTDIKLIILDMMLWFLLIFHYTIHLIIFDFKKYNYTWSKLSIYLNLVAFSINYNRFVIINNPFDFHNMWQITRVWPPLTQTNTHTHSTIFGHIDPQVVTLISSQTHIYIDTQLYSKHSSQDSVDKLIEFRRFVIPSLLVLMCERTSPFAQISCKQHVSGKGTVFRNLTYIYGRLVRRRIGEKSEENVTCLSKAHRMQIERVQCRMYWLTEPYIPGPHIYLCCVSVDVWIY